MNKSAQKRLTRLESELDQAMKDFRAARLLKYDKKLERAVKRIDLKQKEIEAFQKKHGFVEIPVMDQ